MLFAQVVFGLPIDGPFDYSVVPDLEKKIKVGCRALVPFRNKKIIGYIVGLSNKSRVTKTKTLEQLVDRNELLGKEMFTLTRHIADYYFCSWGEAIETSLPKALRSSRSVEIEPSVSIKTAPRRSEFEASLIHDLKGDGRWEIYFEKAQATIEAGRGAIFLAPQIELALEIRQTFRQRFNQEVGLLHSQQGINESILEWQRIRNGQVNLVVGTRLAVFAPLPSLGLIILDNEADYSFKQDQMPHYNTREVAFTRAKLNNAELLLGSVSPCLETFLLASKRKIKYTLIEKKDYPEIRIIDLKGDGYRKKKSSFLSLALQNILTESLSKKEKVLIFLNRKGFATHAFCPNCQEIVRCPRCNVNLAYHFRKNQLVCHCCSYQIEAINLCPNCNSGYIRYAGIGTEKIESELCRIFPAAKISILDDKVGTSPQNADILISTSLIFRSFSLKFDTIAVMSIDNALNRDDLRAAEKTFFTLSELVVLANKKMVIQTYVPQHYVFQAIKNRNTDLFYQQEIAYRKQLDFPPFSHFVLIKVRGADCEKAMGLSKDLFEKMNNSKKNRAIKVISYFPGVPPKLRGKFYWLILLSGKSVEKINKFLKKTLTEFSHSGIIITVDVDPY